MAKRARKGSQSQSQSQSRKKKSSLSATTPSAPARKLVLRIKSNEGMKRSVPPRTDSRKKPNTKQKKKKKQKIDPKKPKKPPTAFFYFLEDFRKEFQEQNPDVKSMRDIGKACGDKWKTMTYEEKVQYYDIATEKRAEFDSAMAEYNKKMESGEFEETDEESEFDE